MQGNPVDGPNCDVICVDDDNAIPWQLQVNPDGTVEHVWENDDENDYVHAGGNGKDRMLRESPVTSAEPHTITEEPPRPRGTLPSGFAERTSASYDAAGSRITAPA